MDTAAYAILLCGALAGGFVSGLAGFGTALMALGIWLYVLPPALAVPLVLICSVSSQLATLPAMWKLLDFRLAWPFVAGGLARRCSGAVGGPPIACHPGDIAVGDRLEKCADRPFPRRGEVRWRSRRCLTASAGGEEQQDQWARAQYHVFLQLFRVERRVNLHGGLGSGNASCATVRQHRSYRGTGETLRCRK